MITGPLGELVFNPDGRPYNNFDFQVLQDTSLAAEKMYQQFFNAGVQAFVLEGCDDPGDEGLIYLGGKVRQVEEFGGTLTINPGDTIYIEAFDETITRIYQDGLEKDAFNINRARWRDQTFDTTGLTKGEDYLDFTFETSVFSTDLDIRHRLLRNQAAYGQVGAVNSDGIGTQIWHRDAATNFMGVGFNVELGAQGTTDYAIRGNGVTNAWSSITFNQTDEVLHLAVGGSTGTGYDTISSTDMTNTNSVIRIGEEQVGIGSGFNGVYKLTVGGNASGDFTYGIYSTARANRLSGFSFLDDNLNPSPDRIYYMDVTEDDDDAWWHFRMEQTLGTPQYTTPLTLYRESDSAGGVATVGINNTAPNTAYSMDIIRPIRVTSDGSDDQLLELKAGDTGNPFLSWWQGSNRRAYMQFVDSGDELRIRSEGSGRIDLWTSGSSKMTILNNGNVGINNTNPANKLTVNGFTYLQSNTGIGVGPTGTHMLAVDGNSYFDGNVGIGTTTMTHTLNVNGSTNFNGNSSGNNHIPYTDGNVYLSGDDFIEFREANSQRVRLDFNTGDGTRLHFTDADGDATVRRGIWIDDRPALTADNSGTWLRLNQESDFTNGVYTPHHIRVDGNIMRGSHTGVTAVSFYEPTSNSIYAKWSNSTTGTTAGDGLDIGLDSSEGAIIWQRENNMMRFATNDTERIRITNGGLVGVGLTNPGADFHVAGIGRFANNTNNFIDIYHSGTDSVIDGRGAGDLHLRVDGGTELELTGTAANFNSQNINLDYPSTVRINHADGSYMEFENGGDVEFHTNGTGNRVEFYIGPNQEAYVDEIGITTNHVTTTAVNTHNADIRMSVYELGAASLSGAINFFVSLTGGANQNNVRSVDVTIQDDNQTVSYPITRSPDGAYWSLSGTTITVTFDGTSWFNANADFNAIVDRGWVTVIWED